MDEFLFYNIWKRGKGKRKKEKGEKKKEIKINILDFCIKYIWLNNQMKISGCRLSSFYNLLTSLTDFQRRTHKVGRNGRLVPNAGIHLRVRRLGANA